VESIKLIHHLSKGMTGKSPTFGKTGWDEAHRNRSSQFYRHAPLLGQSSETISCYLKNSAAYLGKLVRQGVVR
jgi:hypothetical protein